MQKMKNGKKVLSVCLSLAMAAGMLSTSAFASWNVYGGSNNHNAVVTEAPTAPDKSGLDSYIQLHCTGSGWDGVDNVPVLQTVNGTTYAYVLYDGYGASGALVAKIRCAENGGSSIVWTTDPYGTEGTSLNAKSGFQLSTPYLDDKGTPDDASDDTLYVGTISQYDDYEGGEWLTGTGSKVMALTGLDQNKPTVTNVLTGINGQINTPITTDGTYLYFGTWPGGSRAGTYYQVKLSDYSVKTFTPDSYGFYWAGAVSEAGGFGIIACGGAPLDWVEEQVRIARSITDKPIGANVMLMDPNAAQTAELLAKLRVDVITTGAGSPANYMQLWKDAGIKVVPVVASSALAARMERLGADAVVAEGTEAGGHIGELTTMALIPAVCDAVSIPVIAAGGIADGRGMAAAFALGAEGVQAGTRFLTVDECTISDAYKERVIAAKDADTIVTGRGSGHPVRCLKNKFARTVRKLEGDVAANGDELEAMYVGSLRRAVEGDVDNGTMMAGQSAALVHERATAAEAIARMIEEAEALGGLDLEALAALSARRGRAI